MWLQGPPEFYINDRGVQTQLFGASLEAAKVGEDPPEGGYLGAYITEWAEAMPADADPIEWGKNRSLQEAREVLASMHVEFDTWSSEAAIVVAGGMDEVLAALRNGGMSTRKTVRRGFAPRPSAMTKIGC